MSSEPQRRPRPARLLCRGRRRCAPRRGAGRPHGRRGSHLAPAGRRPDGEAVRVGAVASAQSPGTAPPRIACGDPALPLQGRRKALAAARRRHHGGARGGPQRREPRRAARAPRRLRRLRAARHRDASWCSPTAIRQARVMFVGEAPGHDEDIAGPPVRRPLRQAARPHDRRRSGSTAPRSTSPTSCRGGRPATARRRRRRPRSACRSSAARSSSSIPTCWSASAGRRRRRCSAPRTASPACAGAGFPSTPARARSARSRRFHPAFLLRSPLQKRLAWRDFLAIKKALARSAAQRSATRIAPAATSATPSQFSAESFSPRNSTPKIATSTTLNLSIGATCAALPSFSARK